MKPKSKGGDIDINFNVIDLKATDEEITHNRRISFGQYEGQLWTRLPLGYLRHMANTGHGEAKTLAEAELKRRGHIFRPYIELSGHAINRASLKLSHIWVKTRTKDEGIHSWLARIAGEAFKEHGPERLLEGRERTYDIEIVHDRIKFVFSIGHHYPTLKTIMPKED